MTISEKIKTINNKIEQNKSQYYLDRQTAKNSALSSGNVSKNEFLTGSEALPEKGLLVIIKRFKYSLSGKEWKAQADTAKKQCQELNKIFQFDEAINKKSTPKKYNTSNLMYNSKYSFFKYYRDSKKLFFLKSKYSFLAYAFNDLDNFNKLKSQKGKTRKKENKCVCCIFRII